MLLDQTLWTQRVFLGGKWIESSGGSRDVVEPATGATIGRVGVAGDGDLDAAARYAAQVQGEWAAAPHPQRAAVLRTAAKLWTQYADEISWWNVHEAGAVPGMAGFSLHVAEQEGYEAAALPSLPYGELLPSEQPRLSLSRRMPAGVVGVISPPGGRHGSAQLASDPGHRCLPA